MRQANHQNPLWSFIDARGVSRIGHVERSVDFGGTDVSLILRDCATGELCVLSGSRLKAAKRLWHSCEQSKVIDLIGALKARV